MSQLKSMCLSPLDGAHPEHRITSYTSVLVMLTHSSSRHLTLNAILRERERDKSKMTLQLKKVPK